MGIFSGMGSSSEPAPAYVKCCLCGSKMDAMHMVIISSLGAKFQGYNDAFVCQKCKAVFPRKLD